jgi:hypothetical protein
VEKFVKTAKELPAMATSSPNVGSDEGTVRDDMEHFAQVFEQVTDVLSKVEAQQHFPKIIGQNRNIRGVFNQILKVAPTDSTVLISGESGTGKELVATSIYEHSLRKEKPFIKLNCVAIPEGLLESELFGHEKGAFTGANSKKPGKFEKANGGTLFLDEIADMPLTTQAKILRALQEKEYTSRSPGKRIRKSRGNRLDQGGCPIYCRYQQRSYKNGKEGRVSRRSLLSLECHFHLPPTVKREEERYPLACRSFPQNCIKIGSSLLSSPGTANGLLVAGKCQRTPKYH